MEQTLHFRWYNPKLNIAVGDLHTVYLLEKQGIPLHPEVYRGALVFRARGSSRRYSASRIKQGLVRKVVILREQVPDWL